VYDRPIVLGVLVTLVIAEISVSVARAARQERAARREMAALELGLRAAQQGHALAVA
jgi:hypothetical protein